MNRAAAARGARIGLLRVMVRVMRWMTRYMGAVARPLVARYADAEIIACGLRDRGGQVCVIYTPYADRGEHTVHQRTAGGWRQIASLPREPFAGDVVHQLALPAARDGDVYVVRAFKRGRRRPISSPLIQVKPDCYHDAALLTARSRPGAVDWRWQGARRYRAMVYFLAVERGGQAFSGIYTRETLWRYPHVRTVSLSVTSAPPSLQAGDRYTGKMVVVDFDGWVSAVGQAEVVYDG